MKKPRMKLIEIAALIAAGLSLCTVDSYWHRIAGYVIVGISALVTLWVFTPWGRIFKGIRNIFKRKRFKATVMFTDIVNFSSISSQDMDKAEHLLEKNRCILTEILVRNHGRCMKEAVDCTITCFKNAVDAVNCARELQQVLAGDSELTLRIGIHSGQVVLASDDVTGNAVTVASGIELFAEPGGVCISGTVYEAVRNRPGLEFGPLGEKTVKNVSAPVSVYSMKVDGNEEPQKGIESARENPSIAVLPFADMSPGKDQEYLGDGVAEEIINAITQIDNMRVIARTSAFSFKGKDVGIRDIAGELDVEWILEGSIRKSGDDLRITAQLIRVSDQAHVFSKNFDRKMENIFAIQDEIAFSIVQEFKGHILDIEQKKITHRHPANNEAYEYYLLGKKAILPIVGDAAPKALMYYEKALKLDPDFALAYAGIASVYNMCAWHGVESPDSGYKKAQDAINKALSLDSELAEAITEQGFINLCYEYDWDRALSNFNKSLRINYGHVWAYYSKFMYYTTMGQFWKAREFVEKAIEIDPINPMLHELLYQTYIFEENNDEALRMVNQAIEKHPEFLPHYFNKAVLLGLMGKYSQALAQFPAILVKSGNNPWYTAMYGWICGRAGEREKANQILSDLLELYEKESKLTTGIGIIYLGMGDIEEAFNWLNRAFELHDSPLIFGIKMPSLYGHVKSNELYIDLLKKLNLPLD
ncbi:adenylate/guanylate cyclase domain-containing protein [Candidatus Latescibacterota bacterium]